MARKRESISVEGMEDLTENLRALAEDFAIRNAKSVFRAALKDGGKIIAEAGESLAPRGATGGLADSYTVTTKLSRRQKGLHVKESPYEIFVGPGPAAKSTQTEFGNSHQAAQPHLRPAWDQNVRPVLAYIIERATERCEQTRKRLARKAEREAARMASGK